MLGDTLVHRPRLVGEVAAQQGVRELDVRVDQFDLVTRLERKLHLLLAVPDAVGIEPQDLVHQVLRVGQLAAVLEPRRGMIQLLDAALALSRFDQRLPQRLVRLGIVGLVGHPRFQLFDRGLRGRDVDIREDERSAVRALVHYAVEAQIDCGGPAPRRRDRRVGLGLDERGG